MNPENMGNGLNAVDSLVNQSGNYKIRLNSMSVTR